MKTRTIPAQITTVEDRIAGSLNFTQIVLLMIPIFSLMVVYAILPRPMHLSLYKVPIIFFVTALCGVLALRIKSKVVLNWVVILLKYNTRPTYYLFNKNESYLRNILLPVFKKKQQSLVLRTKVIEDKKANSSISIADLARLEGLITNPKTNFSLRLGKKGGLRVNLSQK